MRFDWDQLKPTRHLSEAQTSLLREIGEEFLAKGEGTLGHQKKVALGKNRKLLGELAQLGFIRNNWNRYYPTFAALYYLPPSLRDRTAATLDLLIQAIKSTYANGGPNVYSLKQLEGIIQSTISASQDPELMEIFRLGQWQSYVDRSAFFLQDFPSIATVRESNIPNAPVESVQPTDEILDYEDLGRAWQAELRIRPRPAFDVASSSASGQAENEGRPGYGAGTFGQGPYGVSDAPRSQADSADFTEQDPGNMTIRAGDSIHESNVATPQVKQAPPEPEDSIQISSISDTPAPKDALGFKPYVDAIARFLLSADTEPPLTLSIEGEWGSGKSSFMLQLKNAITLESPWARFKNVWLSIPAPEAEDSPTMKRALSVWFNPWRHDKEESLWAAFALEFLRQVSNQRFFFWRWVANLRLFFAHYRWRKGWFEAARAIIIWAVLIMLFLSFVDIVIQKPWWANDLAIAISRKMNAAPEEFGPRYKQLLYRENPKEGEERNERSGSRGSTDFDPILKVLLGLGGNAACFAVILTIWLKAKDIVGNPVEIDLKKYLRSPDYEGRVAFVEQFHEDFKKIVDIYAGREKVFVFVDDLDRCEVPKAAELMKAVNLLIADDPRLIFILGMDRENVAAGLAAKYEKLLPYLIDDGKTRPKSRLRTADPLKFGQKFLQKFIQLPFRVPQPNPGTYQEFIKTISAPRKRRFSAPAQVDKPGYFPSSNAEVQALPLSEATAAPSATPVQIEARRKRELQFGSDSDKVQGVAFMVSETLGRNPRRLKQFVNLFRLQAYIANEVGLFDSGPNRRKPITLQQLGKFVAISLWWPALLSDFASDSTLLEELEVFATGTESRNPIATPSERAGKWLEEPRMEAFLRYGIKSQGAAYTLSNSSLSQLLYICPQRMRTRG